VKGERIMHKKENVFTMESIIQEGYRNYWFSPADFLRAARGETESVASAVH
jgi:hypothetical protein